MVNDITEGLVLMSVFNKTPKYPHYSLIQGETHCRSALWVVTDRKMAAPCVGMTVRSMWQFRNINGLPTTLLKGVRHFSSSWQCSSAVKLKIEQHKPSPWKLYGAVCLQRLPVVSQDPNPIEQKFEDLLQQVMST